MFDEITAIADQKARIDKYKEVQTAFFQGGQVAQLKALIDHSARAAAARARACCSPRAVRASPVMTPPAARRRARAQWPRRTRA